MAPAAAVDVMPSGQADNEVRTSIHSKRMCDKNIYNAQVQSTNQMGNIHLSFVKSIKTALHLMGECRST